MQYFLDWDSNISSLHPFLEHYLRFEEEFRVTIRKTIPHPSLTVSLTCNECWMASPNYLISIWNDLKLQIYFGMIDALLLRTRNCLYIFWTINIIFFLFTTCINWSWWYSTWKLYCIGQLINKSVDFAKITKKLNELLIQRIFFQLLLFDLFFGFRIKVKNLRNIDCENWELHIAIPKICLLTEE